MVLEELGEAIEKTIIFKFYGFSYETLFKSPYDSLESNIEMAFKCGACLLNKKVKKTKTNIWKRIVRKDSFNEEIGDVITDKDLQQLFFTFEDHIHSVIVYVQTRSDSLYYKDWFEQSMKHFHINQAMNFYGIY